MPRAKLYETNADRQAAYNERKREAERIRLADEFKEQQRIDALHQRVRNAAAAAITEQYRQVAYRSCGHNTDEWNPSDMEEAGRYAKELATMIKFIR